jgi:hypothetical protein
LLSPIGFLFLPNIFDILGRKVAAARKSACTQILIDIRDRRCDRSVRKNYFFRELLAYICHFIFPYIEIKNADFSIGKQKSEHLAMPA